MANIPIDPEMQRRFNQAEKTRIHLTGLVQPNLDPDESSLRAHFRSDIGLEASPLINPHVESRVTAEEAAKARPASVLIGVVLREPKPTLLLTQRHQDISFPGHWVFPGGRADETDANPIETAIREAEEEIGLDPARIEVLGKLGDYVSHSGYRITPVVALVNPPIELSPQPGEVEAIHELALSHVLDSANYFLFRFQNRTDRAHFAMDTEHDGLMLTGVTVSIAIGLYSELLRTHKTI